MDEQALKIIGEDLEETVENPIQIERIELGHLKKIRTSVGQLQLSF